MLKKFEVLPKRDTPSRLSITDIAFEVHLSPASSQSNTSEYLRQF
jgi:hypothetical protein